MKIRELQGIVDRRWPGEWAVKRSVGGFMLIRADVVEMIAVPDLMRVFLWAKDLDMTAYVTVAPRTLPVDLLAIWLSVDPIKARKIRKADRRAAERRRAKRRISDKARR